MKVLHVIDSGGLYGAEVMLLNLMAEQVAMGLEPILASIGDPGIVEKPLEAEARKRGLCVRTFRMRPGPNLAGACTVLRFAWREKVALLHSHGYKGNILFGFLPRFVRRIPMVTTVHGWTWTGGMTRMMAYEWLDAHSLSRMDRVVLVNRAMEAHPRLRNRSGIPLEVVANGIPAEAVPVASGALDPDIIRFCGQGYTIGAIGRLSPEKGFDLLLEALAGLVAEGRDVRVAILGAGGLRSSLEEKVKTLGLADRVLMPGYVKDARNYLSLFGLYAMPSLTEGLPMVLLEAMQASVPVVASRVGGIPNVLQDGLAGLLIEPGSSAALKQGIEAVMDDPQSAGQRVQWAAERVANEFSSRAMAEKYQEIYGTVLRERR